MDYSALVLPFITVITSQITVFDLARFRYKAKKLFVIFILELVIQGALNAFILIYAGYEMYSRYYFLSMVIPAVIVFWYISERRDFRDLFTVIITIFLSFSISIPAMWLSHFFNNRMFWYNIFRIPFFILLFLVLHFCIRKRYLQLQDEIQKGWGVFSILPLLCAGSFYYNYWIYSITGRLNVTILNCIATLLIMISVFIVFNYIFTQLHEKYLVQEQKRILSMQNKAQRDQFEQQKEAAEKTNRRWHDLRHNTQELIELLEAGNTEAALSYLKEQRGVDEVPREEYCLHPAVNSILCLWAERSRIAGIRVEIKADVPVNLEIDPMELSSLFANSFENAYEGCLRLPEEAEKCIKVETHYNGRRLAVGFTNTCIDDIQFIDNMPVSSKKSGGIGTKSIAYTVQRFHGAVYYEAKNGIFTARFILNI